MSLKLSASAQEWKPSFATSTKPAAATKPATTEFAQSPVPQQYQYYNPAAQGDLYNADYYSYPYNPWQMATMGQLPPQPHAHPQQQRRKPHSAQRKDNSRTKKRKKKKKKGPGADASRGDASTPPAEIKPNRVLVFKNLPFSFTVKQLEDIIAAKCQLKPETTSFHRDKNGQFKGFCFVYFDTIKSAALVQERLKGHEEQGRKWTIEFKRQAPDDGPTTLIPTGRRTSSEHKSGSLSAMGMGFKHLGRDKYRSASESDADMNWRRTKLESDFPPKDDAGRKIYHQLLEYKEKHASAARARASSPSSSPSSPDSPVAPLLIPIPPAQKHLQRLVQECLKRLNLDHRIKPEEGEQVTYEITPRNDPHVGMSGLGMGAASAGEALTRRRRGVSTGAFDYSRSQDARSTRDSRRLSSSSQSRKTVPSDKYANMTVVEVAQLQIAKLKSRGSSPSEGGAAVTIRRPVRTESRDFGGHYASGPDGSPGFLGGPRGRKGCR